MKAKIHSARTALDRLMFLCLATLALCQSDAQAQALPEPPPFRWLSTWKFNDTNFLSYDGYGPRASFGLQSIESFSSNAVKISGASALLAYNEVEDQGPTNITCDNGMIEMWLRPDWASADIGGSGPGTYARLIELGAYTQDASFGWWSIYFDSGGTNIYFGAQTNGAGATYLSAPIQWQSNWWHFITLTYSSSNSTLYIDGEIVANGDGVSYWPGASARTNGFALGSDLHGSNVVQATIDNLRTYGIWVAADYVTNHHNFQLSHYNPNGVGGGGDSPSFASSGSDAALADGTSETDSQPQIGEPDSPLTLDSACASASFDYSNKLWLDIMVCPAQATLTLHNTGPDTNYFFFSRTNAALGLWNFEAEAPGTPDANTITVTIPLNGRPNLTFMAGVGSDSDGDGLPDIYEALVTHTDPFNGDTGNTGVPDGFKDPDGDGWTNLDEFRNRQDPFAFNSPPPLTGLFKTRDANNYNVIEWTTPGASASTFTIERKSGSTWQSVATIAGDLSSFTDTGIPAGTSAEYRVRANYSAGSSAFLSTELTAPGTSEPSYTVPATMARGPGGRMFYVASQDGTDIGTHRIYREPFTGDIHPKNYIWEVTTQTPSYFTGAVDSVYGELPATAVTNGPLQISSSFLPYHGFYSLSFQQAGADGRLGTKVSASTYSDATPFLDGRQHALDNLTFALRAGGSNQPFNFRFVIGGTLSAGVAYGFFPTYAVGGFRWMRHIYAGTPETLDPYRPFEDNAIFRNFCFDAGQFDSTGHPLTGIGYSGIVTLGNWTYNFDSLSYAQAGSTNIPATLLASTNSQYIFHRFAGDDDDLSAIGLTREGSGWRMATGVRNAYGLPYRSILAVSITNSPQSLIVYTVTPGNTMPGVGSTLSGHGAYFFTDAEPPTFNTVGFYFSNPTQRDCPGSPTWTSVDQTNEFILGFGTRMTMGGWAKKALTNGYSDKFGYLEQYFDKAYKIAADGTITTNQTGILSEYGDFLPTEPGRVALTTKPDLTGGPTSSATVHVLKIELDVNHDGIIDGRFWGPDNTTAGRPFTFWVNNDYDRGHTVDGSDFEEDDLDIASKDLTQRVPDYAFNYTLEPAHINVPGIPSMRDLEDYARLWTTGISNVARGLPPNGVIELAWRTTSSQNPTLRLFRATEADGGTGYLTDTNTAQSQLGTFLYAGLVTPTTALTLNTSNITEKYIFCATSRGTGELVLRVRIGNSVLAETSAFIQTKDIKEMYERWTAGDTPGVAPDASARPATDQLPTGVANAFVYPYSVVRDTNTPYILHVHGWNLARWEKDRFAEAAFKRLYWQGYQGRFGSFRWPTKYNFNGASWIDRAFDADNFDNSEWAAWRSAPALKSFLAQLNGKYPGRVRLSAHSLGNIAAGEALKQSTNGSVVLAYAALQAALPSHSYDATAPTRSIPVLLDDGTPNAYAHYWTSNSACYFNGAAGALTYANFYNPADYAVTSPWEINQNLKPDAGLGYGYAAPTWYRPHPPGGTMSFPTDTYEIFAFSDEARCKSLGAQINVGGAFNAAKQIDLNGANFSFGSAHKGHSAEFRSTNMKRAAFYDQLLRTFELKQAQ